MTLRLYYGEKNYDKDGNVKSKNESVSITYGSPEWENFIAHVKAHGITSVQVETAYDLLKINKDQPVESLDRYEKVEDLSGIQDEVELVFSLPKAQLTPEQKVIEELKEKLDALMGNSNESTVDKGPKNGLAISKGKKTINDPVVGDNVENENDLPA
ncbi:hypothetical protein [Chryseobacterium sp. M5A1_1a]